jgi:riboflavin-specific deaminase-like protein
MSMDGKIATKARGPMKLGTGLDSLRMSEIRAENDAVINGASTFRAYPFPLQVRGQALLHARKNRGQATQPISAVVSSALDIPRNTPWEKSLDTERWIFCGKEAAKSRILSLEKNGVKVMKCRAIRPAAKEILKAFSEAGVKKLLLEGGGEFNASFLEAGLVSRIYLTLTPLIIGGRESPSWVQGRGFALGKFPRFRLLEARQEKDEVYLTYSQA